MEKCIPGEWVGVDVATILLSSPFLSLYPLPHPPLHLPPHSHPPLHASSTLLPILLPTLSPSSPSLSHPRGKGDYYRLGTDSSAHIREPQLVESLSKKKVTQIAVGSLHCLALTDNGEVRPLICCLMQT